MDNVDIDLNNCFGIEKLKYNFDFSNKNIYAIYAKNGLMKTSFANAFQKIQQGKINEIRDKIFDDIGQTVIKIDDRDIEQKDVFVIKSFESSYESDISPLLIKNELKEQLKDVLKSRDKFLKNLEKMSGIKIKRTLQGKTVYSLEPVIIRDFNFSEKSILLNLDFFATQKPVLDCKNIIYDEIFDESVLKKIKSDDFQNGIDAFILKTDEIYDSFEFLEKGKLTLPKLKEIKKIVEKDSFFVKNNKLVLAGDKTIADIECLSNVLSVIEEKIKKLPELKNIEDLLSDAKGTALKDIIEVRTDIIPYLKLNKLDELKKELWLSYIYANKPLFDDFYTKYSKLAVAIEATPIEDTPWKKCLDIFKNRFTVPFSMEVVNLKGAIIGESVPQIEFSFTKHGVTKKITRSRLEELDTLSQGEKRALYLLNIIFDVEQLKAGGNETLLIIDDIADSFDYKNKYAIIEYLYELSNLSNFKMIILSHNFDFYRTVSSRLGIPRGNRLVATFSDDKIILVQEKYQKQPFVFWKNNLNEKFVIALIPFVRNLIEYGNDKEKSGQSDFLYLTDLLHEKEQTDSIKFSDLKPIYKEYIGKDTFDTGVSYSAGIIQRLYIICDGLNESNNLLEDKILLSMAIRHKAEKFMISEIKKSSKTFNWEDDKNRNSGNAKKYLDFVNESENQTRNLIYGYEQIGTVEKIKIMSEVNIMTPENIHLNSFMYEPLLDMDIQELLTLYKKVKNL